MDARGCALASLREACDDGSADLLGLDVFDTLLVRQVSRPLDAFVILGARLAKVGALPREWDALAFARLRRLAEQLARDDSVAAGRGVEVTLADIYAKFPDQFCSVEDRAWWPEQELLVERDLCFADPEVVELASRAHASGMRVALISDTYFSAPQLDFLVGDALRTMEHRIFTSSDHRVGKGHGLFDVVLDDLDVEARRTLHVGDNETADVVAPMRLGIRAFHLPSSDPELEPTMVAEGLRVDPVRTDVLVPAVFDPRRGDHGLSALRTRAVSRARRVTDDESLTPYRTLGAGILGPVLTGFAEWVVREADALGAARVYCLMREGALLAPLVERVARGLGIPLEAPQLWVSRQVAARAGITAVDEAAVRAFLVRRRTPSVRALAATLGVPARRLASRGDADAVLDDVLLANRVVNTILGDPGLQRRIRDAASAARDRLTRYLDTVLDPADRDVLVVDLGWNGTIQAGLDATFAARGDDRVTHGRYLATTAEVAGRSLDGLHAKGFLVEMGAPDADAVALIRNPEILEMVTLPDSGSVDDYTDDGTPVLASRPVDAGQRAQEEAVRAGIRAFVDVFCECCAARPGVSIADAPDALRAVLRRFLARPRPDEFARFADWAHEDNFGSDETARLGDVDPAVSFAHLAPDQLYQLPQQWWFWPAGATAAVDPVLVAAADRVLDGAPLGDVGCRATGWRATLAVQSAVAGPDAGGDHVAAVTANADGRALVRLLSVVPGPTEVAVRLDTGGERVRIERIRTRLGVRGAADTVLDVTAFATAWEIRRGVLTSTDGWIAPDGASLELVLDPTVLPRAHVFRTEVVLYLETRDRDEQ